MDANEVGEKTLMEVFNGDSIRKAIKRNICPNCGSADIIGDAIDIEGRTAAQDCSCGTCTAYWREFYNFDGMEFNNKYYEANSINWVLLKQQRLDLNALISAEGQLKELIGPAVIDSLTGIQSLLDTMADIAVEQHGEDIENCPFCNTCCYETKGCDEWNDKQGD